MLVKNWMSTNVITVEADDTMQDAVNLLKEHKIRMLPVMEKDKLVGIVTDRDMKRASVPDTVTFDVHELLQLICKIKVREIMTKEVITVPSDYTVEETAEVLLTNKISGVPVVDHEGNMVGAITQTDLFSVLMSVTGMGKRGIQFAFMEKRGIQFAFIAEDRPGSIRELADIIRKYGGRMTSILSTYERIPKGYRKVYIRAYGTDRSRLQELKEEFREKATVLYMVDHRLNTREIYENNI